MTSHVVWTTEAEIDIEQMPETIRLRICRGEREEDRCLRNQVNYIDRWKSGRSQGRSVEKWKIIFCKQNHLLQINK